MIDRVMPFLVASGIAAAGVASEVSDKAISMAPEGWFQLAVQAGMTFVVAIIFLKFLPDQIKGQREILKDAHEAMDKNNATNLQAIALLSTAFERHDEAWRKLLLERGWCPVRDAGAKGSSAKTAAKSDC